MNPCSYLGRHWCELALSASFAMVAFIIALPIFF